MPRASDLSQYNHPPNISCAGPRSIQIQLENRKGLSNFSRSTVEDICKDNLVLIQIQSKGTFPDGWTTTHGFNSFTKAYNDCEDFKFKFCTVRTDDSVTVPGNRPPRIDDILPPLPVDYKKEDVVVSRLEKKKMAMLEKAGMYALGFLMEKEEKKDAGMIFREEQRKIAREVKHRINEDRISARQRNGKSTTITGRGFGPYPYSVITTPSRRESATSKLRKSRKERRGTPSLNPDAEVFYPLAGPSNAPATEAAGPSYTSDAPHFPTSPADPPPPSIPSATLDDYEMEGDLPDGDNAAADQSDHAPDDEDTAMPAV